MAAPSVFTNRGRLRAKLQRLAPAVAAQARVDLRAAAEDTAGLMRRLIPVKSGDAQRSIEVQNGKPNGHGGVSFNSTNNLQVNFGIKAGGPKAFYVRWIEFGTAPFISGGIFNGAHNPGQHAQPFFYPAYRAKRKEIKATVGRGMRKAARQVASKS